MASQVLYSLAAEQGSGINGTVEIRQAESTDTSHIKLQARVVITWVAGYQRDYNALLEIKKNAFSNNDEDKYLNYTFEINKTYESGGMQTAWMDLKSNGSDLQAQSSTTVWVHFCPNTNAGTPTHSYSENSVVLTGVKLPYTLTKTAGSHSSITVSRQSSGVAATGNLANAAIVYAGDSLKITATPDANYGIESLTVNGSPFVSGRTHTVAGNVSVSSSAQALSAGVSATDADIEGTSVITISKGNSAYTCTLRYSFGSLSGTIATKTTSTSVNFALPSTFYGELAANETGKSCTITCITYSGSTQIGQSTCTFTARASAERCSPVVTGTVVDTNSQTTAITGDSSKLVRYKSTALCTITVSDPHGATITTKKINGENVDSNNQFTISGSALTGGTFTFTATNSRGYTTTTTVTAEMIPYVKLTLSAEAFRPNPTDGSASLRFSGKMYTGNWPGNEPNTLRVSYRIREKGATSWSDLQVITPTNYSQQDSTFASLAPIALSNSGGFDYRKAYEVRLWVEDGTGAYNDHTAFSGIAKVVTLKTGVPVFDFGESDFKFNVPVTINASGGLTIGSTSLTEGQLQQLLALLSN